MKVVAYPNIERERQVRGLSKEELSAIVDISKKTYDNYIGGKYPIPSSILLKLSKVFNCSVDYILGLKDNLS